MLWMAFAANCRAAPAAGVDSAQAKVNLEEVRARIAAVTTRLAVQLKSRDALAARVRDADLTLAAQRAHLEALNLARLDTEQRRDALRAEQARTERSLDAERGALAAQVRAAYLMGRQEQIKMLLSQSDAAATGRMLMLYGYFARARSARIGVITGLVGDLARSTADLEATRLTLQQQQDDALRELADLKHARGERASALSAVSRQLSSGDRELADLRREAQAKEALVAELARVLQDFPVDANEKFADLRGKLPWPVTGKLAGSYQDPRTGATSGLRWNGVLIDATPGAKVRAPYSGRVVYADWLQGLGLLLIIGHGGNYMTLYGHAEVLYKAVGDPVAPGEVIAALGEPRGSAPQLYFEIRDGRKAVDPKVWLKAAP